MNSSNTVSQTTLPPVLSLSNSEDRQKSDGVVDSTEIQPTVDELMKAKQLAAKAIQKHYCTDILDAAAALQSICSVQGTSISLIESKTKFLLEIRESYQLEEIIDEAQRYYDKLVRVKREMAVLGRTSKELTRRAAQVKSVREKEKLKKDKERQRLEQELAPRYAPSLTS